MANLLNQDINNKGKIRVIACGMIAREILDICDKNKLGHISLICLPAEYHHYPEKIAPALDSAIIAARAEGYKQIFVGYADCGTGGALDKICQKHGVERIAGPHCFSFYIGNDQFDATLDEYVTTFFITDFLARHYETFLIRPLGLDRHPELRDIYFGNYDRALYLAQTNDAELDLRAKKIANILGLQYERKFTGFGDLERSLFSNQVENT